MGTIRHATLTSELAGNKVGASEWDAAHDIDLGISDISGLQAALDAKTDDADLTVYVTSSALTTALSAKQDALGFTPYNATNPSGYITSAALSGYATTAAVAAAYQPLATVLTNTTASFTTAQETKLAGIATGATAYTDEQAQDAVGSILTDSSTIDFTYNDAGNSITASVIASAVKPTESLVIACSDETTALTTGTGKVTLRMPYAFTLSAVRASLTTAQTSGSIFTVDINEGGTTILSTKLTIDNTEKTSTTAATAAVISDSSLADDAEITIDIDQIGDGTAKGLKVYLIGART